MHTSLDVFLSDFNESSLFAKEFRKILGIPGFIKSGPVEAEFFHADGRTDGQTVRQRQIEGRANGRTDIRTDLTKLIFIFRSFANASKKEAAF
jgi:hypothetical protein